VRIEKRLKQRRWLIVAVPRHHQLPGWQVVAP